MDCENCKYQQTEVCKQCKQAEKLAEKEQLENISHKKEYPKVQMVSF